MTESDPYKNGRHRSRLLTVGGQLLLDRGLGISIETIASEVKISKATFYTYFSGKAEFIEAVLLHECGQIIADKQFKELLLSPLKAALFRFGVHYLNYFNRHQRIKSDRLVACTSYMYPEIAARLHVSRTNSSHTLLAAILEKGNDTGELVVADRQIASRDLAAFWHSSVAPDTGVDTQNPLPADEIENNAQRGVDLFYKLYRP
ncbi:TetR/AcrR family transcriptional regulator [Herbaspirillum lusitanum]|uniref:TetR/AcrR family transcriptional regulator n=1 Tax=Herbaspirillum lusitanum TaxID=213312 RepID=UPI0012F4DB13|nr:TetR/AcrR family transcriptional regulator [Herbaspirillum lusitanum]